MTVPTPAPTPTSAPNPKPAPAPTPTSAQSPEEPPDHPALAGIHERPLAEQVARFEAVHAELAARLQEG